MKNLEQKINSSILLKSVIVLSLCLNGCGSDDDDDTKSTTEEIVVDNTTETITTQNTENQIKTYFVLLSPKKQVGVDLSTNEARGYSDIQLNGLELRYAINVENLGSDTITAGHIHMGDSSTNGSVLIPLDNLPTNSSTEAGVITLTQEQADKFENSEELYINLHSEEQASGLLRGQLKPKAITSFALKLSSKNQVDSPIDLSDNTTEGDVTIEVDGLTLKYTINVTNLDGDTITAGHIHQGDSSSNGGVLFALDSLESLNSTNTTSGTISLTVDQALNFEEPKNLYINIHSNDAPSGLLRVQLD